MASAAHEVPLELEIRRADGSLVSSREAKPLAIVLENQYLAVTLLPELGGRIIGLTDKRSGLDVIHVPQVLALGANGISSFGIGMDFHHPFGNSDYLVEHAADEESDAVVWIGRSSYGPVSFQLKFVLPVDRAELLIQARVYNRSLSPVHYNGGLAFGLERMVAIERGLALWEPERKCGLAVDSLELTPGIDGDRVVMRRFSCQRSLAPHQLDSWAAGVMPLGGLSDLSTVVDGLAVHLAPDRIEILSAEPRQGLKLRLRSRDGSMLEAPADLEPGHVLEIELPSAQADPAELSIVTASKVELLSIQQGDALGPPIPVEEMEPEPLVAAVSLKSTVREIEETGFDLRHKSFCHLLLAILDLREGRFDSAAERFEEALLFNAEDHLAWWGKAAAHRLAGADPEEERPELLNAHYLAPLEPMLRAEAFLSQPIDLGSEANPLLKQLARVPENLVEVASMLVLCGLYADAARWIDEALRHADLAMLRYLRAYCLLVATRMDVEAGQEVSLAGRLEPFAAPWREQDVEAIRFLGGRFPNDARLGELNRMIDGGAL